MVLNPTNPDCQLLKEEVFGPVLPVVQYNDLDEVLRKEAALPHPSRCTYSLPTRPRWTASCAHLARAVSA